MDEIRFDSRNYRKHNEKNKALINRSLAEYGAGRSILIDSENEIIAGNGVYEQAKALGIPVKIIETDGSELVAVRRTDLKTKDRKRKYLAVSDNATSDTSENDLVLLQEDFSPEELYENGIEIPNIEIEPLDESENAGVKKKLLKCPVCGHINEEKAFRNYQDEDSE